MSGNQAHGTKWPVWMTQPAQTMTVNKTTTEISLAKNTSSPCANSYSESRLGHGNSEIDNLERLL